MGINVRVKVGDNEPIEKALRRFKKLVEKAGIKKEVKQRRYYEKPSEVRRNDVRKQARNRRKTSQDYKRNRPVYYISVPKPKESEGYGSRPENNR